MASLQPEKVLPETVLLAVPPFSMQARVAAGPDDGIPYELASRHGHEVDAAVEVAAIARTCILDHVAGENETRCLMGFDAVQPAFLMTLSATT